MKEIIYNFIRYGEITEDDILNLLYYICDKEHASCNNECPVYEKTGGIPWNKDLTNCKYFRKQKEMLNYLKGE